VPSRISCRKVVQRIFARIETTSFGERRQYVNDVGNVQLLSIIGVDKCIFIVGCPKKDFLQGSLVMIEMDRLLVQMQRAFAQHIARAIQVGSSGRVIVGGSEDDETNQSQQQDGKKNQQQQHQQLEIAQESLVSFDSAVQNAIDETSTRIADIIYHAATASMLLHQQRQALLSRGVGGSAGGIVNRLFSRKVGGNDEDAQSMATNNKQQQQPVKGGSIVSSSGATSGGGGGVRSNYYQHADSLAQSYLSGATGADDDFNDPSENGRKNSIFGVGNAIDGNAGGDDDSDDEENDKNCCSRRTKFIICFVILFLVATVIFVLLFACERKGENDFSFHCGSNQ
jgi:hypothetical protein